MIHPTQVLRPGVCYFFNRNKILLFRQHVIAQKQKVPFTPTGAQRFALLLLKGTRLVHETDKTPCHAKANLPVRIQPSACTVCQVGSSLLFPKMGRNDTARAAGHASQLPIHHGDQTRRFLRLRLPSSDRSMFPAPARSLP
jgi:hypothetical protein